MKDLIEDKEKLLELIFFYYNAFVLRTRKRNMTDKEKELLRGMKIEELIRICENQKISIEKSELKGTNSSIWENVFK